MADSRHRAIKWARWAVVGGAGAIFVVALLLLLAPRPIEVEAGTAALAPIADSVADEGYARVRDAYVISAPVTGRLQRLDLDVGDRVQANATVVARIWPATPDLLDPRTRARAEAIVLAARAAVGNAQAQQEQIAAEAHEAAIELARARELAEQGVASRRTLDAAEARASTTAAATRAAAAQLGVRRAELKAAQMALLGPEAQGRDTVPVTSPASGYVTRLLQESERTVQMGAPLVEVSDQHGLEAAVEFLSQDAVRIGEGMPAEVYDWGGPAALPALVRRVEPQAFTKVSALGIEEQRVLVLLQFTGPPASWARLGPGYRLWGRVFLRREPHALTAPLGALVRSGGRWAVFRIVDRRARLTPVEVGALTDRSAEITAGLKPGDSLIVFPSDRVRDGVRIRVREEP